VRTACPLPRGPHVVAAERVRALCLLPVLVQPLLRTLLRLPMPTSTKALRAKAQNSKAKLTTRLTSPSPPVLVRVRRTTTPTTLTRLAQGYLPNLPAPMPVAN
jgi:hypothetical protein